MKFNNLSVPSMPTDMFRLDKLVQCPKEEVK